MRKLTFLVFFIIINMHAYADTFKVVGNKRSYDTIQQAENFIKKDMKCDAIDKYGDFGSTMFVINCYIMDGDMHNVDNSDHFYEIQKCSKQGICAYFRKYNVSVTHQ